MPSAEVRNIFLRKKEELAALELEIRELQRKELLSLPDRVGVSDVDTLIDMLLPLASNKYRARLGSRTSPGSPQPQRRKPRVRVTNKMRSDVLRLLETDAYTAAQIAEQIGVSASYVNKLKASERRKDIVKTAPGNRGLQGSA